MRRRKKHRRLPRLSDAERQRLRDELPPLVTLDAMGDLGRFLAPSERTGRCVGESHSLIGTLSWIRETEFFADESEILTWLGSLGGGCDCTIRSVAFPRILELSRDVWE